VEVGQVALAVDVAGFRCPRDLREQREDGVVDRGLRPITTR